MISSPQGQGSICSCDLTNSFPVWARFCPTFLHSHRQYANKYLHGFTILLCFSMYVYKVISLRRLSQLSRHWGRMASWMQSWRTTYGAAGRWMSWTTWSDTVPPVTCIIWHISCNDVFFLKTHPMFIYFHIHVFFFLYIPPSCPYIFSVFAV